MFKFKTRAELEALSTIDLMEEIRANRNAATRKTVHAALAYVRLINDIGQARLIAALRQKEGIHVDMP